MSKIADTLRVLAVALPGFVLLPKRRRMGVQKIGFINTERVYQESKQAQNIQMTLEKRVQKPSNRLAKAAAGRRGFGAKTERRQAQRQPKGSGNPKMAQSGTEIPQAAG